MISCREKKGINTLKLWQLGINEMGKDLVIDHFKELKIKNFSLFSVHRYYYF